MRLRSLPRDHSEPRPAFSKSVAISLPQAFVHRHGDNQFDSNSNWVASNAAYPFWVLIQAAERRPANDGNVIVIPHQTSLGPVFIVERGMASALFFHPH